MVPLAYWAILMLIGAMLMRGAGCTYNDMVDKDLDKHVKRTASRPLAAGTLTRVQATLWMTFQMLASAFILWLLPSSVWGVALLSLPIVALYPWMKRFTSFPQLVLGLAFNWGVWIGWFCWQSQLTWLPFLVYLAGIFWTLAYDTIYAFQDIEDDQIIGIKSTARYFATHGKLFIGACYALFWLLISLAGWFAHYGPVFFSVLAIGIFVSYYRLHKLNLTQASACLHAFKNNVFIGSIVAFAFIASKLGLSMWGIS